MVCLLTPFVIPCLVQSSKKRRYHYTLSHSTSKLPRPDLDHLSAAATVVLLLKPFSISPNIALFICFALRLATAEPQRTTTATSDSGGLRQWFIHFLLLCFFFFFFPLGFGDLDLVVKIWCCCLHVLWCGFWFQMYLDSVNQWVWWIWFEIFLDFVVCVAVGVNLWFGVCFNMSDMVL